MAAAAFEGAVFLSGQGDPPTEEPFWGTGSTSPLSYRSILTIGGAGGGHRSFA